MTIYKMIKKFFKQIVGSINHKIDLMNQKEAERIQALEEKNRKQIERNLGIDLRKRWALALNSLPDYLRISSIEIDYYSLSNSYKGAYWEICIPIHSVLNNINCRKLTDQLAEILSNQSLECNQEFESKLICDSNEYKYQIYRAENGCDRTINDFVFIDNYMKFCESHYFKLIDIMIINVNCAENNLYIKYNIDTSACMDYDCINYFKLISR